jgi:predicted DNA-binding WGR domain protein
MYQLKDEKNGRHEFWMGEIRKRTVTIQFGKVGFTGHRGSRLKQKIEEGYQPV